MKRFCICVLMMSGPLHHANASGVLADHLPHSLRLCMHLKDDATRLSCYDHAAAALAAYSSNDSSHNKSLDPALSSEEKFGLSGELAKKVRKQNGLEEAPVLDNLTSQVVSISQRARGEMVLTLSNGQIWAQSQASKNFILKIGESVTIRPGALGSFLLSNTSGRATRVTRVQ